MVPAQSARPSSLLEQTATESADLKTIDGAATAVADSLVAIQRGY